MARRRPGLADNQPVRPQCRAGRPSRGVKAELRGDGEPPEADGRRRELQPLLAEVQRGRARVHGVPRWPGAHQGYERSRKGAGVVCEVNRALTFVLSVHRSPVRIQRRKEKLMSTITQKKLLTAEEFFLLPRSEE